MRGFLRRNRRGHSRRARGQEPARSEGVEWLREAAVSAGEEMLAFQLRAAKICFEREYRFAPPRRWRFDFVLPGTGKDLAIEVEGGAWNGGHKRGAAADTDCEKANAAVLRGWNVLRFTPAMVEDGRALATIEKSLRTL
jgi:very-short-patch-repair endonuclease